MSDLHDSRSFPLALKAPAGATVVVDSVLVDRVIAMSRESPRGRMILPLHPTEQDSLQRMLNAIQPASYIRPHRHVSPPKAESIVLLRGSIGYIVFTDGGEIDQTVTLSASSGRIGVDARPGTFHTFFALEEDTVLFEVKPGPYRGEADKQFAPWSPAEGSAEAQEYLRRLERSTQT